MEHRHKIGEKWEDWKKLLFIIIIVSLPLIFLSTRDNALKRVEASRQIMVITRNNAHCYYTYRDEPRGFEYDLAKAFSEYLGVELKIITPKWQDLHRTLNSEEGDFIAANLGVTPLRKRRMAFSDEYLSIQQMVVLHTNNDEINSLDDLAGKTIHVRRGTSYEERLNELRDEGLNINIKLYDDIPTEELIRMVSEKEIEVTIAASNVALLNRRYYPDVRIAFPIEESQSLGWAVRRGERALLRKINAFFKKIKEDGTFDKLYDEYYANVEVFDYVDLKRFHLRLKTRLPKYKGTIQKAADRYGFDWRLIAAVVYQESHFNRYARSYTGVRGLMQLTLNTAKDMRVKNRLDPEQSIMGGTKYLRSLYKRNAKAEDPDRLLMALASYNVGHGHVVDAQKIAEERGLDPYSWSSIEQTLPLLRYRKYYKKTRYGYCRGTEPVRYVNRILTYYAILKREGFNNGLGIEALSES
ncbi:MAG: membrane-bound lytic murein transglycosylase MltF [Desulfatiglans sp.]|nr:membrane-bound lytic murein transglycosylase MltF [Thermodesulfobacteriota bacterium]MEE4351404.1 membrane-bound lytic murein transglycosylase MltF [Desulfatiglans sp.]